MSHNVSLANNFCEILKTLFPDIKIMKIEGCCFCTIILPCEMNFIIKKFEVSFAGYEHDKIVVVKLINRYGKLIHGGKNNPLYYESTFQSVSENELVEDITELYNIHKKYF